MSPEPTSPIRPPSNAHFAVVAGVAVIITALGLHAEWFVRTTAGWEPTEAQVTTSEWRERAGASRKDTLPVFTYRYIHNETLYTSDRYSYRGRHSEGVAQFKQGEVITAYVNPHDPKLSVIARDMKWWDRLYAPLGTLLLVATALKWRSVARKTRSPE